MRYICTVIRCIEVVSIRLGTSIVRRQPMHNSGAITGKMSTLCVHVCPYDSTSRSLASLCERDDAGFVAPEVIDGGPHSPALDMFAVGVMLYITITGRRPMTNRQANTLSYSKFEAWDYPHMHVRSPLAFPASHDAIAVCRSNERCACFCTGACCCK
jgi:hypothetical protein